MAAPARIYLGILIFSLIAVLLVVPLTIMILAGYEPPSAIPLGEPDSYTAADKTALTIVSAVAIFFLVRSWNMLVAGARRRRDARAEHEARNDAVEVGGTGVHDDAPSDENGAEKDEQPPGYG